MKIVNTKLDPLPQDLSLLLSNLRKKREFNPKNYVEAKSLALHNYLKHFNISSVVVAVSGGVDSAVVLALAKETYKLGQLKKIVGVTLPVLNTQGVINQEKAKDLAFLLGVKLGIEITSIDLSDSFKNLKKNIEEVSPETSSWAEGQLVPYLRTPSLYYLATLHKAVILGTTNKDEGSYLGYFGKASDGLVDLQMISDIHKSEVFKLGEYLRIPNEILSRTPTGDMFDGRSDEEVFGCSYDFVELFERLMETPYKADLLSSLSPEGRDYYQKASLNMEKMHKYNYHKYLGKSPAIHLDLFHNKVSPFWGNRLCEKNPINFENLNGFSPISLPNLKEGDPNLSSAEVLEILNKISECSWQEANENGYREITSTAKSYRLSLYSEPWANMYFERIRSTLDPFILKNGEVFKLVGVSPLLRFIKYKKDGFLLPHYDSSFPVSENQKTLKSLVIYLTDNNDGRTRFIKPRNNLKNDWSTTPNSEEIIKINQHKKGYFLCFDHDTLHDSETCSTEKIIIRTDLVYEKVGV